MTTWQEWAGGVLAGILAPATLTNLATVRGWSTQEKGAWPSIQWCNPLNTTETWPGAVDSGAQPGAHDVKIYPNLEAGVAATVTTLVGEPYYPAIVRNLRASLPARSWGADARAQLVTWGTGAGWLNSVPLQGDSPTEQEDYMLFRRSDGAYFIVDASGKRQQASAEVVEFKAHGAIYNELGNESIVNANYIPDAITINNLAATSPKVDTVALSAALTTAVTAAAKSALAGATGGLTAPQIAELAQIAADAHATAGLAPDVAAIRMRVEKDLAA